MKLIYRKIFYNTVLSQVCSSCEKYLFAGNNFGDVFILSTKDITAINRNNDDYENTIPPLVEPILISKISKTAIKSLAYNRDFLIVGTIGIIYGYKWNEQKLDLTKKWEIKLPTDNIASADINYILIDKETDYIYVGCGNNIIYCISLEDGKNIREFKGHNDFIHCLAKSSKTLYSASEDGSILFWDEREQNFVAKIEPYLNDKLIRPDFGKWQGTVSVTNDWLLCGGGPKASMWHPRAMECTTVLQFPGKVHCSEFVDDRIIIAGEYQSVDQYNFNGEKATEIQTSGTAVYSIAWQNEPYKFLSFGGASNELDICTNFDYRDLIVKLYKKS